MYNGSMKVETLKINVCDVVQIREGTFYESRDKNYDFPVIFSSSIDFISPVSNIATVWPPGMARSPSVGNKLSVNKAALASC